MFKLIFGVLIISTAFFSCADNKSTNENALQEQQQTSGPMEEMMQMDDDDRISLNLNDRQKQHQLKNMRSHLVAVQTIIELLAKDDYDLASKVAYTELGSTTEMKLMCASFGNEQFENMGLAFHASADKMSEIIKTKDKKASLEALSITMNYCVQCHANFRQ